MFRKTFAVNGMLKIVVITLKSGETLKKNTTIDYFCTSNRLDDVQFGKLVLKIFLR